MHLILIGPPGAGKGVLGNKLSAHFHIPAVSTGDIFRTAVMEKTALGKKVQEFLNAGKLVPDDIVEEVIREVLSSENFQKGFLLDGFPRTVHQAEMLDDFLLSKKKEIDAVVKMVISREVILRRLTSRRVCPVCSAVYNVITMKPKVDGVCDQCSSHLVQRKDDTEEVILSRLALYREQTAPVLEHYAKRGKIIEVDSSLDSDKTLAQALRQLA